MDFSRLTAYLDSLSGIGVPGCDLIVSRGHEVIYRHMMGSGCAGEPMRGDEMFRLYSCTKLFTTCAVMQLVERGVLQLDDPVAKWLPAYGHLTVKDGDGARPAQRTMTLRHLLSMQSGLDYEMETPPLRAVMEQAGENATTRQLVDAKAQDPLRFEPGTDFLYSLSHDVLGAVIESATGLRFSEYLRRNIWQPLGLERTGFSLSEADADRLCDEYAYNSETRAAELRPRLDQKGFRKSPAYESGGGGLLGCVEEYGRFVDALACGGVGANGARIISPETIQLWSANQLTPKGRRTFDGWRRLGYSYGLGVRVRVDNKLGGLGPVGEFGWDGYAGAWAMVDPAHCVSAFFAMHVGEWGYLFEVVHPNLRALIYEGLR